MRGTDELLGDLAARMRQDGQRHPAQILTRHRIGRCNGCLAEAPVRRWPLGDQRRMLCDGCWTSRARGGTVADWNGRTAVVHTTHPQRGRLYRGLVQSTGIEARDLQPVMVWRLTGHDGVDLGEHAGDYVDAQARLLDATSGLDEIDEGEQT